MVDFLKRFASSIGKQGVNIVANTPVLDTVRVCSRKETFCISCRSLEDFTRWGTPVVSPMIIKDCDSVRVEVVVDVSIISVDSSLTYLHWGFQEDPRESLHHERTPEGRLAP